jgi:hypothetical protein
MLYPDEIDILGDPNQKKDEAGQAHVVDVFEMFISTGIDECFEHIYY